MLTPDDERAQPDWAKPNNTLPSNAEAHQNALHGGRSKLPFEAETWCSSQKAHHQGHAPVFVG
jgi:hypothetical protein